MGSKVPDLAKAFGSFVGKVPTDSEQKFIFSEGTLPLAPSRLKTSQIVIKKAYHYYGDSYRAHTLQVYMSKETCRQLGALMLTVLFHPNPPEVWLDLVHPESEIKSLVLEHPHAPAKKLHPGYHSRPFALVHFPAEPAHMFKCLCEVSDLDKVELRLTNSEEALGTSDEEWNARNVVKGVGNDRATAFLGEFLLNAGRPESLAQEHALDGFSEIVAPRSAELRLWLPGALGWCHGFCDGLE